jgi:hypothetical protein
MADVNDILFYNSDYVLQNTTALDSLGPYASYKTASWALTDVLLGQLTNDVILRDGTRAFNANQSMGVNRLTSVATPVNDQDAANKKYVDDIAAGLSDFQAEVLSSTVYSPPVTPTTGDRYLIGTDPSLSLGTGAWAGHDGQITTWDGLAWTFFTPGQGTFVYVTDIATQYIFQTGSGDPFLTGMWVVFNSGGLTGGDGIIITANVVHVDLATLAGLKFVGGQLAIAPVDFVDDLSIQSIADEISIKFATPGASTAQAVKASDLISFGTNQGAKILGFDPTNVAQTVATTVQEAIEDAFTFTANNTPSVSFVAGVNLDKGDVVQISGATPDQVEKFTIQSPAGIYPIGAAMGTVTGGSSVKISQSNSVATGVLSGATTGQRLYWNNLTGNHEPTPVTTPGWAIVQSGFAKNSTDLYVNVQLVRING